jgi:pilus assembly protein CpaC
MRRQLGAAFAVLNLLLAVAPGQTIDGLATKNLGLVIGRGELLRFNSDVLRMAVAEPKIADAIVVSPREVMVNAKGMGNTTVVVWTADAAPTRFDVRVTNDNFDLDTLRDSIVKSVPGAEIILTGNDQSLVITGTAPSSEGSKRAQAMAATHAKTVVNMLRLPPAGQPREILLQVKFASIDRTKLNQLGFNLFSANNKTIGETSTQQFTQPRFSQLQFQNQNFNNSNVNFSDLLNLFVFRPDLGIGATIQAMQQQDIAQVLAEPNLIVMEGKTASFLAGGQFPFPVLTATTTGGATAPVITVQFKPFGVKLEFTPNILPGDLIDLAVTPEVSELDYTNAVTLQGFQIPALSTRRADTEVILKDGESFAIAGLIDNRVTATISKVPWLGDIPILGQLFKSRSTQKTNTELLVLVTPHFVRPLGPGEKAKLPPNLIPYLPPAADEKAAQDKKKGEKDPEFVGPSGHQQPN